VRFTATVTKKINFLFLSKARFFKTVFLDSDSNGFALCICKSIITIQK